MPTSATSTPKKLTTITVKWECVEALGAKIMSVDDVMERTGRSASAVYKWMHEKRTLEQHVASGFGQQVRVVVRKPNRRKKRTSFFRGPRTPKGNLAHVVQWIKAQPPRSLDISSIDEKCHEVPGFAQKSAQAKKSFVRELVRRQGLRDFVNFGVSTAPDEAKIVCTTITATTTSNTTTSEPSITTTVVATTVTESTPTYATENSFELPFTPAFGPSSAPIIDQPLSPPTKRHPTPPTELNLPCTTSNVDHASAPALNPCVRPSSTDNIDVRTSNTTDTKSMRLQAPVVITGTAPPGFPPCDCQPLVEPAPSSALIDLSEDLSDEHHALVAQTMTSFHHIATNLYKGDQRILELWRGDFPVPNPNLVPLPRTPMARQCSCWMQNNRGKAATCNTQDCINFAEYIFCPENCKSRRLCGNQAFGDHPLAVPHEVFVTKSTGLGVRTMASIARGCSVMEYIGEVIKKAEFESRYASMVEAGEVDFYFLSLRDECFIDARNYSNNSRFINHSCEPNCAIEVWKDSGVKRAVIVALDDIGRLEELTFDYNWWDTFDAANFQCRCGKVSCTRSQRR